MKVHFNKVNKKHTNRFSFDNNTTLGIGNVQPLFCKQMVGGSKISVNFAQLTRLSPLVVPTFARLKQRNDFAFVPIGMVMPSFDAFLSRSMISGINLSYTPNSVPCTTNASFFVELIHSTIFCYCTVYDSSSNIYTNDKLTVKDDHGHYYDINNYLADPSHVSLDALPLSYFDYIIDSTSHISNGWASNKKLCVKFREGARYWLTVLRGLGYSVDPNDALPVSILPLWAFAKAYYDLYYPKRTNPWHASNYYYEINKFYNGVFFRKQVGSHVYDFVKGEENTLLPSLFGNHHTFDFFATIDDSLVTAATANPINENSNAGDHTSVFNNVNFDSDSDYSGFHVDYSPDGGTSDSSKSSVPALNKNLVTDGGSIGITADQLRLVDKLWSFVQKSSVVGQSVKDWFVAHLGVKPNEDMFDQTTFVESIVNDVSINTVISTAQTSSGDTGDNLGALAGQGYASKNGNIHFETKTFGYFMCLTSLVPISGVSCGTQPELYQNTLYEQQLPDFDGLGYEVLNKSSFEESFDGNNMITNAPLSGGFGYVPRLSSWKAMHNIRSGNFAINSVRDSFLPYNVDVIPRNLNGASILWRFPWSQADSFVSFNRIFYNSDNNEGTGPLYLIMDDNFMCQTSFEISYTSFLKPLSDSYSVESLGKELVSVKEQ